MNLLSDFFERKSRVYLLLVLVPVLVYLKGLFYGFSPMDDQWLIVEDVSFLEKWSSLTGAFSDAIQGIYYRPVFVASLIFDYHIGGLNPLMYHTSNLVFHVLAVLVLYRFLCLLQVDLKTSALLSLLFSVHPVLVHAVEWIPGRNDSMLCLFSLLSFIYLVNYSQNTSVVNACLHILFFVCALFTKETAIVLPLVYAVLFFIYGKRNKAFGVMLLAWLGGLVVWYYLRNSVVHFFPAGTTNYAAALQEFIISFIGYIGKALLPAHQSVSPTPANTRIIFGCAVLALLVFVYFKAGVANKKIAFFGLFMFVVFLVLPVWYGVLSPLGELYEHRIYTPLAGLFIFAGQLRISSSKQFTAGIIALVILFSIKTVTRLSVYKNELSYLNEGIAGCADNYIFQFKKGDALQKQHKPDSALIFYNTAIRLQPNKAELYNNRGNAYSELGKKKEAIEDYTTALRLSDNNPKILLIRSMNYTKFNDPEHAMADLTALKKCCQNMVPAAYEKELTEKWVDEQFVQINALILKTPGNAANYITRAQLFFNLKQPAQALNDLKKACELEPGNQEYKTYYRQLSASLPR